MGYVANIRGKRAEAIGFRLLERQFGDHVLQSLYLVQVVRYLGSGAVVRESEFRLLERLRVVYRRLYRRYFGTYLGQLRFGVRGSSELAALPGVLRQLLFELRQLGKAFGRQPGLASGQKQRRFLFRYDYATTSGRSCGHFGRSLADVFGNSSGVRRRNVRFASGRQHQSRSFLGYDHAAATSGGGGRGSSSRRRKHFASDVSWSLRPCGRHSLPQFRRDLGEFGNRVLQRFPRHFKPFPNGENGSPVLWG